MSITESRAIEQRCNELTPDGSLRRVLDGEGIRNHSILFQQAGNSHWNKLAFHAVSPTYQVTYCSVDA